MQYFFPSAIYLREIDLYAFSIYHVAGVSSRSFDLLILYVETTRKIKAKASTFHTFSIEIVAKIVWRNTTSTIVCLMLAYLCALADLNAAHNLRTYNYLLKIILTSG
jgi:hypothetical protein